MKVAKPGYMLGQTICLESENTKNTTTTQIGQPSIKSRTRKLTYRTITKGNS